jgi:hypothetical protein
VPSARTTIVLEPPLLDEEELEVEELLELLLDDELELEELLLEDDEELLLELTPPSPTQAGVAKLPV